MNTSTHLLIKRHIFLIMEHYFLFSFYDTKKASLHLLLSSLLFCCVYLRLALGVSGITGISYTQKAERLAYFYYISISIYILL